MAGTVVSTTPRPTYGGRTLSSRERQLEARFRTTYIPNFQATSPSYAAVGSPHVMSSRAKTASALGRQGVSMLGGAAIGAILPGSLAVSLTGLAAEAAVLGTSTALTGLAGSLGSMMSAMAAAAPYIAVALVVAGLVMGMTSKSSRNIQLSGYSLPANAPDVLKRLGLNREPITISRYRYFQTAYDQATAPLNRAHTLVQQRLGSLSRIFPGMRTISSQLEEARAAALGGSGSQGEAFSKLQGYADGLYKAEGFIEELFQDPMAQSYMGRKTKMPFEEFEKGFKFSTDVWIMDNLTIPGQERARQEALAEANRATVRGSGRYGYIGGSQAQGMVYNYQSPMQIAIAGYEGVRGGYVPAYGGGYGVISKPAQIAGQYIGGTQAQASTYRPPEYSSRLTTAEYNARYGPILSAAEASAKAQKDITAPFDAELAKMRDFTGSTPQFGDYTMLRPFEPNWTPGTPQLGLPADAPGPDLDTLKERLTITDEGYYGGMAGGGIPQFRFSAPRPRMSQRGMARQGMI